MLLLLAAALPLVDSGCGKPEAVSPADPSVDPAPQRVASRVPPPKVLFTDVTAASGIGFVHTSGAFGKKLLPETMGAGVAVLDFDNDGRPDLLFVNSCCWPGHDDGKPAATPALYRNRGDGSFEDVTRAAGLDVTLYGMGVTVGDFDNDGLPDVFITALGGGRLFRNSRDATGRHRFVDVTAAAGDLAKVDDWRAAPGDFLERQAPLSFPSSAAFVDYDKDGRLDLFVCHYVTWSPRLDLAQGFTLKGAGRAYGPPRFFKGSHCALYRNLGGGKFEDVSARAGVQVSGELGEAVGKSLGVAVCDVDDDGWPDVVVANDTVRNFLFHNRGDGTFAERGQEAGVAYAEGSARGAMGIDWGEYRLGLPALVIGNFANEPNTLLRLDDRERLLFSDVAQAEGLAGPSRIVLKFGLFFFDFDLDGLLDLLTCNGHLEPDVHLLQPGQSYRQPVQLYWNCGGRSCFEPVTAKEAGPDLFRPLVGRGCAFADLDGDGDLDVVLVENGGPARVLRNEGGTGNHWVRLVLEGDGKTANRSAVGAVVTLTAGGKVQRRTVASARGYLSQSDLAVTFGLGKEAAVERVEVRWPDRAGTTQVLENVALDRVRRVRQGGK